MQRELAPGVVPRGATGLGFGSTDDGPGTNLVTSKDLTHVMRRSNEFDARSHSPGRATRCSSRWPFIPFVDRTTRSVGGSHDLDHVDKKGVQNIIIHGAYLLMIL